MADHDVVQIGKDVYLQPSQANMFDLDRIMSVKCFPDRDKALFFASLVTYVP